MAQEIKSWNNSIVEDQAGSTLPTVNADDNGKTLQVVDGQWDKGAKIPDPQLPAPAVGDIGKVAGVVSDGEGGAKYGFIEKKTISFSYTRHNEVYGYYPNVKGKTATLQELYEYFVELGLAGAQQSTDLSKYFDFEVDVQRDPNLPSDFTAVGAGASRFKLDLMSAYVIGGDYYSFEIKGTQLSSPENITNRAGIASIYMKVNYNQWTQTATVEVKTIPFATSTQN